MSPRVLCILAAATVPAVAQADRGALTLEIGGGLAADSVAAPYATSESGLTGWTATVDVAARYAMRNSLEILVEGFYEPPATYYHAATAVQFSGGSYTGTLRHRIGREGVLAGVRAIAGMEWRPFVELKCGWSHRSYSDFALFDTSQGSSYVRNYGLELSDVSSDNFEVAASLGMLWTGDKFAVSVAPRVERLLGARAALVFSFPVAISWSWYL